jgi:hypothetical protein
MVTTYDVRSRSEIVDVLRGLGKPRSGRLRVFRGQTREHRQPKTGRPSVVPTLLREGARPYDPGWLMVTARILAVEAKQDITPETTAVYAPALIQHYGPGSSYVDVTSNIDIALWFALHVWHQRWFADMLVDVTQLVWTRHFNTAWYTPLGSRSTDDDCPVVYVFDLEPWDGRVVPEHAQLIDLLQLPVAPWLLAAAARLKVQDAALAYVSADGPNGPDLGDEVRAVIRLAADFDEETAPIAMRPVREMFPGPQADACYRQLLALPAQLRFDPIRLEHPLDIPWYLTAEPNVWQAPNSNVLGAGTYAAPAVSNNPYAGDEAWSREIDDFVAHSASLDPPVYHAFLSSEGPAERSAHGTVELRGQSYRFEEATPFLLESTVYLTTPDVASSMQRRFWIESALHLGIADSIAGRRTDSVYVEFSALDSTYPRRDEADDRTFNVPRAVWIVRREPDYSVRLYMVDESGPLDFAVQLHFNSATGRYEWTDQRSEATREAIRAQGQDPDTPFLIALKALFVGLTLLRDLSPGFKPPVIHHSGFEVVYQGTPMSILFPPGELEPQRAVVVAEAGAPPYLIPGALDGSPYARGSAAEWSGPTRPDGDEASREAIERYFDQVNDPYYRIYIGLSLAELNAFLGRFQRAREVVESAIAAARTVGVFPYLQDELLLLHGKICASLGDREAACRSLRAVREVLRGRRSLDDKETTRLQQASTLLATLSCE